MSRIRKLRALPYRSLILSALARRQGYSDLMHCTYQILEETGSRSPVHQRSNEDFIL